MGVNSRINSYGYGTVPGGRWTIDTEGGHVVVSVSQYEIAMNTEPYPIGMGHS